MNMQIEEISIEKKSILRNMIELYKYDFSEYDGKDLNDCGLYEYKHLDHYWTEEGRFPYFIKVNSKYAGFILVKTKTIVEEIVFYMSEFFIMKKYRRSGIGTKAAFEIFDRFPGTWVVGQTRNNTPAQKFWRKVINQYTNDNFEEITSSDWDGPLQKFKTRK